MASSLAAIETGNGDREWLIIACRRFSTTLAFRLGSIHRMHRIESARSSSVHQLHREVCIELAPEARVLFVVRASERAAREQTLGDRIGDRMRSRLAQMCIPVEMKGADFRQSIKRASFA